MSAGFRAAVAANAECLRRAGRPWLSPGRWSEGIGFEYLEPDAEAGPGSAGGGESGNRLITVEVQNGSGATALPRRRPAMLEALGYTLLPPWATPSDFPDVRDPHHSGAGPGGGRRAGEGALGVGDE